MGAIVSTAFPLQNGVNAIVGVKEQWTVAVGATWATNETLFLVLTNVASGRSEIIGFGPAGGIVPSFLKTFGKKMYLTAGTNVFFSGLNAPTELNDPARAAGVGFLELANEYGFADDLLAIAIFRRQLAFFGRRHVQIWNIDPDPSQNSQSQTLENSGTVNGASVRGIGTLDVLYCADSGVRSLSARQSSEDAVTQDLGSPIDDLIQAALDANGTSRMASIIEPRTNRYWLAIGTTIYVFSYFPSTGVAAWSTYVPSYESSTVINPQGSAPYVYPDAGGLESGPLTFNVTAGRVYYWTGSDHENRLVNGTEIITDNSVKVAFVAQGSTVQAYGNDALLGYTGTLTAQVDFTPEKIVVFDGKIYVRATDGKIYQYGGSAGTTYDGSVCSWETPWLDAKTPGTNKPSRSVDLSSSGKWRVKLGMSPEAAGGGLVEVYKRQDSSFWLGRIGVTKAGTHFKARGETYGNAAARFGMFLFHFDQGSSG